MVVFTKITRRFAPEDLYKNLYKPFFTASSTKSLA